MTFDKLRVSIFEAYQNDEISRETCQDMLESVLNMEGDHIVAEGEAIRSDFMNVALECANGSVEFTALEKKAETFGEKVKAVWEKFKAWVKKIVDSIKNKLFPKKSVSVRISDAFDKGLDKASQFLNAVSANADFVKIAEALLGVAGAAGAIFAGKKFVTKRADDIHKKILKVSTGFQKLVDKIYSKLPPKIQESGIMKAIREWLSKLQTADAQVVKEAQKQFGAGKQPAGQLTTGGTEGAPALGTPKNQLPPSGKSNASKTDYAGAMAAAAEPQVNTTDNTPTTPSHRAKLVELGVKQEDIPELDRIARTMIQNELDNPTSERANQIIDGDPITESTGDFDLDEMLAELGI